MKNFRTNFNIILFFLVICNALNAQSLHHQMISCQGGVTSNLNEPRVLFTIGQQSVNGTTVNGVVVQQGFQQNNWNKIIEQNTISISTIAYPNPFKEVLNFSFSKSPGKQIDIAVFDLLGRLVYSNSIKNEENVLTVNLNFLPSAEYLVKLTSNDYIYSTKIIKQ